MAELPSCSLCRHRRDPVVEFNGHAFCAGCLTALGRFVRNGSRAVVERIWSSRPSWKPSESLGQLVVDEMSALERGPFPDPPDKEFVYSVEEVFADFKKGLEKIAKPEDVETHLDLAVAYREMGLLNDALSEVAIALENGAGRGIRAGKAVAILFESKMLRVGLDEAVASLRGALYPE